jgi:hypothetical protein
MRRARSDPSTNRQSERHRQSSTANLLPRCAHHHGKVHDAGWQPVLGPKRQLTITFPDGTVHDTGPSTRSAA